jgi:hypothetical protein
MSKFGICKYFTKKSAFMTDIIIKVFLSEIICYHIFSLNNCKIFFCFYIMATLSNKKLLKSVNEYFCEKCNYITIIKHHYEKHISTKKHKLATFSNKKLLKSVEKYNCDDCNYITSIKQNYEKHINSQKHLQQTNTKLSKSVNNKYQCKYCDKEYTDRSGLWRHNKVCNKKNVEQLGSEPNMMSLVLELVKQNSEFKELLMEQNKQNKNLQNQFIELAKEKNIVNTNNIHNTTNNTNFNLTFFLNETCKNAMNISDFVEQIPIDLSDLEDTARLGYAEGISRIFINGLKQLEVNQRPIHCSDAKRETLYIKDENKWEKDDINKSNLEKAIRKVGQKNIRMIPEWKKKYPDCEDYYSKKNDLYLKIVGNSMCGGSVEETEYNYNKIKKNIIKQSIIKK